MPLARAAAIALLFLVSAALTTPTSGAVPRAAPGSSQDPAARTESVVHGRLVGEDGAPLAGVTVQFEGNTRIDTPTGATFQPWSGPTATSGADGEFRATIAPPALMVLEVRIEAKERAPLHLSCPVPAPSGALDLKTLTVPRECRIVGQVLDRDGGLLVTGWTVRAQPRTFAVRIDAAFSFSSKPATIDPDSGSFQLQGLIPGEYELVASGPHGAQSEPTRVTVLGGERAEVSLATNAPRPDQVLSVTLQFAAPDDLAPAPGTLYAVAPSGARVPLEASSPRSWHGVSSEPLDHTLVVDDPRFLRLERPGVRPGTTTTLELEGSATLELVVLDPDTGAPVPNFGVAVRHPAVFDQKWRQTLFKPGERYVAPRQRIQVVPGEVELALSTVDRPLTTFPRVTAAAGETRTLQLALGRGFTLTGRVVDARGKPVAGASVELTRGDIHGHVQGGTFPMTVRSGGQPPRAIPAVDLVARTDATGAFTAPDCARGQWAAFVSLGPWVTRASVVELAPGEPCELTLPAWTPVEVALAEARGADALACTLRLAPVGAAAPAPVRGPTRDELRPDGDGRFPPVHLPLGRMRFELLAPSPVQPSASRVVWTSVEDVTVGFRLRIEW